MKELFKFLLGLISPFALIFFLVFLNNIVLMSDIDKTIWKKDPQRLEKLLDQSDKEIATEALHKIVSTYCTKNDDVIMIDVVLAKGANINSLNKSKFTPLDMCLNKKVALHLRKNGGKHWYELMQEKNDNKKTFE